MAVERLTPCSLLSLLSEGTRSPERRTPLPIWCVNRSAIRTYSGALLLAGLRILLEDSRVQEDNCYGNNAHILTLYIAAGVNVGWCQEVSCPYMRESRRWGSRCLT